MRYGNHVVFTDEAGGPLPLWAIPLGAYLEARGLSQMSRDAARRVHALAVVDALERGHDVPYSIRNAHNPVDLEAARSKLERLGRLGGEAPVKVMTAPQMALSALERP